jgi:hypothetical protein
MRNEESNKFIMNRTQSYFMGAAAVILFILAALNFCGAAGTSPALNWPDALLPLSNRWVLVLCGGAEIGVSAVLLAGKSKWVKFGWLAWLTTNLLVYRIGLWSVGASNFGDYLGNYIEWFTISPRTMSLVTEILIGFMFIGGYAFLVINWLRERKRRLRKSVKTATPGIAVQPAS